VVEPRTRQSRTLRSSFPHLLGREWQRHERNAHCRYPLFLADSDQFNNNGSPVLRRRFARTGKQITFFSIVVRQHTDGLSGRQLGDTGNTSIPRRRFHDLNGHEFGHSVPLYCRNVLPRHVAHGTVGHQLQFLKPDWGVKYSKLTTRGTPSLRPSVKDFFGDGCTVTRHIPQSTGEKG